MSSTFDIIEFLDRTWFSVGMEQSETEKGLFRDELQQLAEDAMYECYRELADMPHLRHMTEAQFTITLASPGIGAFMLLDDSGDITPSTPPIMTDRIRQVYHIADDGTRTRMYKLGSAEELDRPQPQGIIWWWARDTIIETIDLAGNTRYSDGGNALDGSIEVHATYVPSIGNFTNKVAIQPHLVRHLRKKALEKKYPQLLKNLGG